MPRKKKKKRRISRYFLLFLVVITFLYIVLSIYIENQIKKGIHEAFGSDLFIGKMSVQPVYIRLSEVRLRDTHSKKILFKADSVQIRPHIKTLLEKRLVLSSIKINRPSAVIEVLKEGNIRAPFTQLDPKKKREKKELEIYLKRIRFKNGMIDFIDHRFQHKIRFKELNANIDNILLPKPSVRTRLDIEGLISGKGRDGSFRSIGWINLGNKNTDIRVFIKNLEIDTIEPYRSEEGRMLIESCLIDANSHIVIKDSRLSAPGIMRLKELRLNPRSKNQKFLGVSYQTLLAFLKDTNGIIELKFDINGDISNPEFSIRDSLALKLGESAAKKLGSPIGQAGKAVKKTGKKGADVFKGIKSIAEKIGGFLKGLITPQRGD